MSKQYPLVVFQDDYNHLKTGVCAFLTENTRKHKSNTQPQPRSLIQSSHELAEAAKQEPAKPEPEY